SAQISRTHIVIRNGRNKAHNLSFSPYPSKYPMLSTNNICQNIQTTYDGCEYYDCSSDLSAINPTVTDPQNITDGLACRDEITIHDLR
ncbi:MAG: hypothetical protein WAK17_00605, partial [Candidatus Nitrosopolaris sp.]